MRYDKDEIKNKLTTEQVFSVVKDFGGDPQWTNQGFVSATICHNHPGEGSHKLYYYSNSRLFRCYTECDASFDIFELVSKVQKNNSLYKSVSYIAKRFGFGGYDSDDDFVHQLDDWDVIDRYKKLNTITTTKETQLKTYDKKILNNLPSPLITDWIREGIKPEILKYNKIGYYPTDEQITIPHFDKDGNFIGLRGRALGKQQAEMFGKYRPIQIGHLLYNHPLGYNLYNLNNSYKNIQKLKKVIVYEGEKSCLLYQSYFGLNNDISVACCGSSISLAQIKLLLPLHPNELIIAFDRQYKELGDDECKHWVKHLKNLYTLYNKFIPISFIFDKSNKLDYKDSPIDKGVDTFLQLYRERVIL